MFNHFTQKEAISTFDWLRSQPEVVLIGWDATRFYAARHSEPTWGIDLTPHNSAGVWKQWSELVSKVSFL